MHISWWTYATPRIKKLKSGEICNIVIIEAIWQFAEKRCIRIQDNVRRPLLRHVPPDASQTPRRKKLSKCVGYSSPQLLGIFFRVLIECQTAVCMIIFDCSRVSWILMQRFRTGPHWGENCVIWLKLGLLSDEFNIKMACMGLLSKLSLVSHSNS